MQFKVIAHRGASADAPENTAESFWQAIHQGADMIETDVRASHDGSLVLAHDAVVEGKEIASNSLSDLVRVKPDLLTVEEALATFSKQIPFCWEIKDLSIEHGLLNQIRMQIPYGIWRQTHFTSFSLESVCKLRQIDPKITVGWLTENWNEDVLLRANQCLLTQICPPGQKIISAPELLKSAEKLNLQVRAWGLASPDQGVILAKLGIYGATVDWPARMRETLLKRDIQDA